MGEAAYLSPNLECPRGLSRLSVPTSARTRRGRQPRLGLHESPVIARAGKSAIIVEHGEVAELARLDGAARLVEAEPGGLAGHHPQRVLETASSSPRTRPFGAPRRGGVDRQERVERVQRVFGSRPNM